MPFKTLLTECWETDPTERPTFDHILKGLTQLTADSAGVISELTDFATNRDSWLAELSIVGDRSSHEAQQEALARRLAEVTSPTLPSARIRNILDSTLGAHRSYTQARLGRTRNG